MLKSRERAYVLLKNDTRNFKIAFRLIDCNVTIGVNFERSQNFNFETDFMENLIL